MPSNEIVVKEAAPVASADGDVSGLVRLAIEQKVPVEVLERLVALQERVTDRAGRAAFFAALAAFQAECPAIHKSADAKIVTTSGGSYGYTYAPLEEIARTIRPHLHKHGLSYTHDTTVEGSSLIIACVVRHVEGHSERSTFPVPTDTSAKMSGAQKNGAALTYGRRMSLIQALGITTADEDTDGAEGTETGEAISDYQAAHLAKLIADVGADLPRLLKYLGVDSLAGLPLSRYDETVTLIERKRKGA